MDLSNFIDALNQWGKQKIPFFFLVDFEMKRPFAVPLDRVDPDEIIFNFNDFANTPEQPSQIPPIRIGFAPIPVEEFKRKFDHVSKHLEYGDSYLTNLTVKTRLELDLSLKELFYASSARYRLLFRNEFVVFSPERFVQIRNGKIYSYPMKGTIDASLPDAAERLRSDVKEIAEHVTIVDLIRNDLAMVADNVTVTRFRYIEELQTNAKNLLQVSSQIEGILPGDYRERLGTILVSLLPAGSISGAPKSKTMEIIRQAEGEERGYYTGVAGIFDGNSLDSGVLIRFIENKNGSLYYRSGGGITTQSVMEMEYQEAIDKVYVPVN